MQVNFNEQLLVIWTKSDGHLNDQNHCHKNDDKYLKLLQMFLEINNEQMT